jgi:hypothetical protein
MQAIPPTDPRITPGKVSINGKLNTSSNPPLPRMAAIVCRSCQIMSKTAAPVILIMAARLAVTTPETALAANDPDRHVAEKSAASKITALKTVDTVGEHENLP